MAQETDRVVLHVVSHEDLVDRISHFDSFRIGERIYTSRWLIPQLIVQAADLASEISTCAALVLYWGLEAARARREKARIDSAYRQWRDRQFLAIKSTPVSDGAAKFPSDTVAEKTYRTLPDYGVWQRKIDDSQEQAELAEAIYEAFRAKRQLIAEMQQHLHDQAAGPYFVSENQRQTVPRSPQVTPPQPTTEEHAR